MRICYWRFLRRRTNEAIELVVHDLTDCECLSLISRYRTLGYPRISPEWKLLLQRFSEGHRQFRRLGPVGCCFSYFFAYFFTSIVNSAP